MVNEPKFLAFCIATHHSYVGERERGGRGGKEKERESKREKKSDREKKRGY